MIETGKYNTLKILRQTSVGLFLGDDSGEDVLLPNKYCPENFTIDEEISVFVYRDYAERKIATNLTPKIFLYEFALLRVTSVEEVGAFLDWGLEKELLVPFSEQRQRMIQGRWYVVYLDIDVESDRLFATNKTEKHLQNDHLTVEEGQEVDLVVFKKTDLGFSVIVNHQHKGLVYTNEVFREVNIGDKLKGFVKGIRDDNKMDISLHPIGYENFIDPNCDLIYRQLMDHKGFIKITDNSSPEEIYLVFGMSKKAFKKALGALYKQRKVEILPDRIKLI